MTVRETIKMLSYGTDYILIGARTGKKLTNLYTKEETKEKYMDLPTTDNPIGVAFHSSVNKTLNITEYVKPVAYIWVSGK